MTVSIDFVTKRPTGNLQEHSVSILRIPPVLGETKMQGMLKSISKNAVNF